jgi:glycosyltransferase involved in cell wall biosynthesis
MVGDNPLGVLMLSWEFPPRIIGGIAAHLNDLSKALTKLGIRVFVLTCDFPGAPAHEELGGISVYRVDSYRLPTPEFATWTAMMNVNLQLKAAEVLNEFGAEIQLLHAHDWLVANAGIGLKHLYRLPLLATIHSTEQGRRGGLFNDYQRMIHEVEAWLVREAWRLICCSGFMASEVTNSLGAPHDRVDIIPNGVEPAPFHEPFDKAAFRARFARPEEKLVLYVGRLVHEKGVGLLVEAIPRVLRTVDAKFAIVGEGYMKEQMIARVQELGVAAKTFVSGFLDTLTVRRLFATADVFVVPSLYEPFGIVALEAMAARTPVVTTGAGGLSEIVQHDQTGVRVFAEAESLAWGITRVLTEASYADALRTAGFARVSSVYRWDRIAELTAQVYRRALKEYEGGTWKPRPLGIRPRG